ncbi:hypothetical protein BJX65DRAFT_302897 [Aspergillus insuetus]
MESTPPHDDYSHKCCPKCKRYGPVILMFISRRGRELKMCHKCRVSSQNSHRRRRMMNAVRARRGMAAAAAEQKRSSEQIDEHDESQNQVADNHDYGHGGETGGEGGEGVAAVTGGASVVVAAVFEIEHPEAQFVLGHNTATLVPSTPLQASASFFPSSGDFTSLPTFDHPSDDHFDPDYMINRNLLDDSDEWFAAYGGLEMPPSPIPDFAEERNLLSPPVSDYAVAAFHVDSPVGLAAGVAREFGYHDFNSYPVITAELSVAVPSASAFGVTDSYSGVDYDYQALLARFLSSSAHVDDVQTPDTFDNYQELVRTFTNTRSPSHAGEVYTPSSLNGHQEINGSVGPSGHVHAAPNLASVDETQTLSSVDSHHEHLHSSANPYGHYDAFHAHAAQFLAYTGHDFGEHLSTPMLTAVAETVDTVETAVPVADLEFYLTQFPDLDFADAVFDKEEQMPKNRVCRFYHHHQDSTE